MLFDLFTKRKKSCMENEILEQAEITKNILEAYLTQDGNINIDIPEE